MDNWRLGPESNTIMLQGVRVESRTVTPVVTPSHPLSRYKTLGVRRSTEQRYCKDCTTRRRWDEVILVVEVN